MKHTGVRCFECGDVIYSIANHDYHSCTCGGCHVDGGFEYLRFGWNPDIQMPEVVDVEIEDRTKKEWYDLWSKSKINKPIGLIPGKKKKGKAKLRSV